MGEDQREPAGAPKRLSGMLRRALLGPAAGAFAVVVMVAGCGSGSTVALGLTFLRGDSVLATLADHGPCAVENLTVSESSTKVVLTVHSHARKLTKGARCGLSDVQEVLQVRLRSPLDGRRVLDDATGKAVTVHSCAPADRAALGYHPLCSPGRPKTLPHPTAVKH